MNKSFYYLISLLFAISGCHPVDKKSMNIEGQVSSEYDGQIMYLVPRPHPTPQTVDSTIIKNGAFAFNIPSDSAIYDITISRKANAPIQRLLIIAEEGVLRVKMDISSSSQGTPLNDKLQHWKEQMETAGEKAILLTQKISKNKENKELIETLKEEREAIYESFGDSTFNFIKQNMNPLGGYLFSTLENRFNEQQSKELKKIGIEQWNPQK